MAGQTHAHAVDARPAVLGQLLSDPAQLGADDPAPLEQKLQGVSRAWAARQDEVTLGILLKADGLRLQDTHALALGHELQVLHPALDRVHLHQVQPAAGEQRRGYQPSTISKGFNSKTPDVYRTPICSPLCLASTYLNHFISHYVHFTDNKTGTEVLGEDDQINNKQ